MIAVNQLVQNAYESIGMVGLGEAAGEYGDGNMPVVAVNELNRLIAQLNNEGYLAMTQKWIDAPNASTIYFRKLKLDEAPPEGVASIDMEPPEKVVSVARKIGDRFCVLNNCNLVQMSQKNPYSTAMSWTYGTELEDIDNQGIGEQKRVVGILRLDGSPRNSVRIWYNSKIPNYTLDDTVYLSDLYNELLMSGLCVRLANYFELSPEKKASLESDFISAKTLIKRNNATQRMQQCANIGTSWQDTYYNGMNGIGM